MNGDVIRTVETLMAGLGVEDADTLVAVDELVSKRMVVVDVQRSAEWYVQGWRPNAPGLVCRVCGGPTWGIEHGGMEVIRCVSPCCGVERTVVTKGGK